jgi:hypothetical protein
MKRTGFIVVVVTALGVWALNAHEAQIGASGEGSRKAPPPTAEQVLMRDKLSYANKALEGYRPRTSTRLPRAPR